METGWFVGQMRGGETGGVKQKAQDAIAAIRNAKELLGEGPRFKDVDSVAFNAGDARQQSITPAAPRSTAPIIHLQLTRSGLRPFGSCQKH